MTKLSALFQEVFCDQAPLAAVGLPEGALTGVATFAATADLPKDEQFAGALWAGPLEEAAAAALALRAAVKEGGIVVLAQVRGNGPLAVMRTWFTAASRSDEVVEGLCSALLCGGFARPSLLAESAALTAAMGVRVPRAIV